MKVVLPDATLGVIHRVGDILSSDMKSGVSVFVRGDLTVFSIIKDGQKFFDMQFGPEQTEHLATFFKNAADFHSKQGGSGLPPPVRAQAKEIKQ